MMQSSSARKDGCPSTSKYPRRGVGAVRERRLPLLVGRRLARADLREQADHLAQADLRR
jgi:hypothetical protein